MFLMPGLVSPELPAAFAVPVAYGDLTAAVLALLALTCVRAKSAAAGSSNAAASSNAAGSGRSADSTDPLPPSQLGSPGGFFGLFSGGNQRRDAQAAAPAPAPAGEPPRRSLIDPPAGYQAASPSQPYGGARVGSTGPKPGDHALGDDQGL